MKDTEPNSLQRALPKGEAGPHPDADVLTAFTEGALLPHERENMLEHLALCGECRQVLSVAGDAAEPAKELIVGRRERPGWRVGGPLLAAAALIALATTVGIGYVLNRPAQNITVATKNTAVSTAVSPVPPAAATKPDSLVEKKHSPPRAESSAVAHTPVVAPTQNAAGAREAADRDKQMEAQRAQAASPPIAPAMALSQAEVGPEAASRAHHQAGAPSPSPPSAGVAMPNLEARATSPASAFSGAAASRAQAAAAGVGRLRWRINAQGQPERAFGEGSWQPVAPSDSARMEVISVFGGEVWTGGESSQVFRSLDNGTTWRPVNLPGKDGAAHTIAHIRIESSQAITIVAADGTTWSTTDGGTSWK